MPSLSSVHCSAQSHKQSLIRNILLMLGSVSLSVPLTSYLTFSNVPICEQESIECLLAGPVLQTERSGLCTAFIRRLNHCYYCYYATGMISICTPKSYMEFGCSVDCCSIGMGCLSLRKITHKIQFARTRPLLLSASCLSRCLFNMDCLTASCNTLPCCVEQEDIHNYGGHPAAILYFLQLFFVQHISKIIANTDSSNKFY